MNARPSSQALAIDRETPFPEKTELSYREPSPRIAAIRQELLTSPCSLCLERPILLRRFQKSREGRAAKNDHPIVRRAKALAFVMANRTPRIYKDELIIGNMTSKRIAANYYPEGGSVNILEDLFRLEKRQIPITLTGREKINLVRVGRAGLFSSIGGRALLKPGRKHTAG